MVIIREATSSDNEALIALDRQCAMGETFTLAFDRFPDFFARHKAYERWTALVAEAPDGTPVGTGGLAVKTVLVGGRPVEAAYLMDLRVHPDWRHQGVAMAIGDAVRERLAEAAPAFAYIMVLRGNEPAMSFVRKRGVYTELGSATLLVLVADESGPLPPGIGVRQLRPNDMDWLAEHWAACTGEWSLALPFDAGGLERLMIERLQVPPAERLVVARGGVPIGAAAMWEYSRIMAISFVQIPEAIEQHLSPTVHDSLAGGTPFRFFYPLPLVWRSLEDLPVILSALLAHLEQKRASEDSATTLWLPLDAAGPVVPLVGPKAVFSIDMDLFGVAVRDSLPTHGPFFIDPRDI